MPEAELKRTGSVAYREALHHGQAKGDPVLCIHGFPESSYMWHRLLPALAGAGYRALAPDLPGFGDSAPDPPGTWEHHLEAIERFRTDLDLGSVALVVHDWGGLVGLRWACDHPGATRAIVASDTGFFPDGKWHGLARGLRTPDQGEEIVAQFDRDGFAAMMTSLSAGFDEQAATEYWKAFERPDGRQGILDLYRSGDFEKITPYAGKLAALEIPFLALWGSSDEFAPVAGAYRFRRDIPHAEVVVVEGAGHFVFADAPEACAEAVVAFLDRAFAADA